MSQAAMSPIPELAGALPPELLQTVLDGLPVPVSIKDTWGDFLYVNPRFAALFGGETGALPGDARAGEECEVSVGPASYLLRTFPLRNEVGQVHALCSVWTDITEQKRAEERARVCEEECENGKRESERLSARLRETGERLQAIVDNMPAIVYVKDREGRYLLVNREIERIWGRTRDEILGRTDRDLVPVELAQALGEHDRRVLQLSEPQTREVNARGPDGTPVTLFSVHFPLHDASGKPSAVCGLSMDITPRKQAEDALRKYQDIFEFIEQGLVVSSTNAAALEMANPAYARMHGYTVEELTGLPIAEVFAPECLPELPEMIRIADERGYHTYESVHKRKDGSTFPVHIAMTAVRDAGGKLRYRIGSVEDITSRRQAEKTLRDRAELLDLTQDAILVRERDGRIVYWNAAAQARYGWTAEEARGQVSHVLFQTRYAEGESSETVDAELLARGFWEGELVHTRRDGTQVIVSSRQALRRDPTDGSPIAILEVNSDITARKRAEAAQRAVEEERYWLMREAQNRAAEMSGVMESIPDALLIGNEAVFTLANQPALDLFGCRSVGELNLEWVAVAERAQVRDARTGEYIPPEQWPFHLALSGAPQVQDLVVHHARLGRDVILRCAAAPVRVNNHIVGAVCVNTDLMRSRQQTLIRKLIEAQEEERRAVAYELHDGLTQYIMAAHAHLETFLHLSENNESSGAWDERADREVRRSLIYLDQAVIESRRLINGLRALALEDLGLAGALEQTLGEEKARAGWTDAEMAHNIAARRFPKIVETTVFRVAQEALTNARKHARATRVRVVLRAGADEATGAANLSLEVRDWGSGFAPDARSAEYGHLGLQGMVERVHLLGGTYHLHSAPGQGTTIHAVFPTCVAARSDGDALPREE